ncbi:alkaline phosphatase D, partial [Tremellales sp. Uapishka_1]
MHLDNLVPDTRYSYATTAGHAGSFITRRPDSKLGSFTLLSTSCQKAGWPYNPLQNSLNIRGLVHLDTYMRALPRRPEAMLFLGDFISPDSDLPLPRSEYTMKYYRRLYRQIYASPSWTKALLSLPFVHMFDDHEIVNDFAPGVIDSDTLYDRAIMPFNEYHLAVNPPSIHASSSYTSFNIGRVAFFVLDNRTYRTPQPTRPGSDSTAGHGNQTMLGEEQKRAVRDWALQEGEVEGRLLVLVTGVPVTRNWSEGKDEMDSWAGYLDEREEILELLWSSGGAVIISGDRHEHGTPSVIRSV